MERSRVHERNRFWLIQILWYSMDIRDSTNDKLRALPYNFTEFGANCTVHILMLSYFVFSFFSCHLAANEEVKFRVKRL